MSSDNKIGFWSVFAIVTGSQIGTGVFMLPTSLASFGVYSLIGWLISGVGAISLCFVFASLCARFPETGGPHTYIHRTFGEVPAFFVGWTYWLISWVSSTAVVVTAITSLHIFIGDQSPGVYLGLEIALLLIITLLNLMGLEFATKIEFFLTLLKFIPLLIISLIALPFFDANNLVIDESVAALPTSSILRQVTVLTLWGFIGLECATTPAGSVLSPGKNIPRAIIFGTLCVALLYFLNSIAIMGIIPGPQLMMSTSPYADVAQIIFGGKWHLVVACVVSIICIGTLNAWIISSSQVVLGLAEDGLMPKFFTKKNQRNAPIYGIVVSCIGIIPLLILTTNKSVAKQINTIIDFSVVAFIFVYLSCCFAFLKLLIQNKGPRSIFQWVIGIIATGFCFFIIFQTPIYTLMTASSFVLSAIPMYLFWYNNRNPSLSSK